MATRKRPTRTSKPVAKKGGAVKAPSRRKAAAAAPAAAATPVTLEEAQALAAARAPARAVRRGVKAAAGAPDGPTPATVGLARKDLEAKRDAERQRRLREYAATMDIMKRRGARRTPAQAVAGRRRGVAAAAAAFRPLQVMAEGDSWFDYPVPLFGGGIIKRLQKRLGVPILNMADAGDEVRFMLGCEQRQRLMQQLTDGCPAGGPWDVVLFSGGGNDIVDNPMALWVGDFDPAIAPADHLIPARFAVALALVRAGYEDLIALRNALSPTTHLVFHAYDFAIPDGRGICHLGPWLKPTFDMRRFPNRASATAVVRSMLQQFAQMLGTLTAFPNVSVVATQGTLAPLTSSWHNELHPSSAGFDKFAELFRKHLQGLFPDRVA